MGQVRMNDLREWSDEQEGIIFSTVWCVYNKKRLEISVTLDTSEPNVG